MGLRRSLEAKRLQAVAGYRPVHLVIYRRRVASKKSHQPQALIRV